MKDFNVQTNLFLSDFKNASSFIRNYLFFKYCTSFYGSQFLPMYNDTMNDVIRAWRVAVRRVWRVPWSTHCLLLPHLANVMSPELSFSKRAISFTRSLLKSNNDTVRTITGMGVYGQHSILGANARHLIYKYDMNCKVVNQEWKRQCTKQAELIRMSQQIKELCYMRDTHNTSILSRDEIKSIIAMLCTE